MYRKPKKNTCTIEKNIPVHTFIQFYKAHYGDGLSANDYQKLTAIATQAYNRGQAFIYACHHPSGSPMAMVLFLKNHNRIIYHSAISTDEGYSQSAMFGIVDEIICDYAGSDFLLDFEGSEMEGIARFYQGFGAVNVPYSVYENPFMLNLLKWLIHLKRKTGKG